MKPESNRLKRWQAYAVTIAITAATFGLRLVIESTLNGQPTMVMFTLPVIIGAYVGGLGAGLLSTALSYLAARYYLVPPIHSFRLASGAESWQLNFFVLAGVVISLLNEALHHARHQAEIAIHDLKQSEESLRLLSSAVRQSKESILITDAELDLPGPRIVFVNPAFTRMTGYTEEEALGKTPRMLQGSHTDRAVLTRLRQNLERGEMFDGEAINYRKDGTEFELEWQIAPIRSDSGTITHFVAIQRDITARKQAEASSDRMVAILESTTDIVGISDPVGRLIFLNRAGRILLGVGLDEDVTKILISDFLPNSMSDPVFNTRIPAAVRDGTWSGETVLLSRSGREIPVSQVLLAHKTPEGNLDFLSTIMRDLTDRKRFEADVFQSRKMETVAKLAGGVAHEFNSIMTAIIGQTELLLHDLPPVNPLCKNVAEIRHAAERAATLTRQLLAYGRKQFLQSEILDLNAVLAGMGDNLHLLMGESVEVRIAPAAGLKAVQADAGQLEQVIMNIVRNSADAMPGGGTLTLETANVTLDQEYVRRFPELKPGEYVMLAITDTGEGMSEDEKAHIFEPFFTTKGMGAGKGMGLSPCYGIIKQSGGHISVDSEPTRGTTFKIYLPQPESLAKIPIRRLDTPDLPRGMETILLVEDDPTLRNLATTLLRRLGYTVLASASSAEALNPKDRSDIGRIDLVFTDVGTPNLNGKELSESVRALNPHSKILYTSGSSENAGGKDDELMQKPFTPSELAKRVRQVLDR